jgi:hypothetical protein
MKAEALQVPSEGGDKWRLRLMATAAALLLGTAIYLLQRMPAAETLSAPDDELTATSTQALALYNIRAAPVMQYDGAVDSGLRLSVSTGRLAPATRRNLFELKIPVPNVKGAPIQWQARPPKGGRISVRIGNQRQDPAAGMMLQATGSGQVVELNIRAVETNLPAQIDIAAGGSAEAAAPELRFGDVSASGPALSFTPLQIEIPPGESLNLTFDNQEALANSSFRLGELLGTGGSATALSLGRAAVGRPIGSRLRPELRSVIAGVCAARPGRLLYTHLYPRPGECRLAADQQDDNLFATELKAEPRKVGLALEGSGYVIKDGHARPTTLWAALMGNPLIAALIAALVYAIARPLWRLWTGRDM